MKFQFSGTALALLTILSSTALAATTTDQAQTVPYTAGVAVVGTTSSSSTTSSNTASDAAAAAEQAASDASGETVTATNSGDAASVGDVSTLSVVPSGNVSITASSAASVGTLVIPPVNFSTTSRDTPAAASQLLQAFGSGYNNSFAGQMQLREGSVDPVLCQQIQASSMGAAADRAQRTSDLIMQTTSMPSATQTGCLQLSSANLVNAAIDLAKSSGFAKKFYNDGVLRKMQSFASNFPMGGQLVGVVNNLISQSFTKVLGSLNLGGLGSVFSAATRATPINTAAINCDMMGKTMRAMRCITRVSQNPASGLTDDQCLNRSGLAAMGAQLVNTTPATEAAARQAATDAASVTAASTPAPAAPDLNGLY